ncbi:hypothetical protein LINPERPRIM_LOCUS27391 [Linum perenne]
MVSGGQMVLTLLGRRNEDCWELISVALNQMAHDVRYKIDVNLLVLVLLLGTLFSTVLFDLML